MRAFVPQLFLEQADRQPEHLAIASMDEQWNYEALATLVRNVADYLKYSGVAKGDRIAMVMGNSAEYVAIYYGIQLAGACAVALNTLEPASLHAELILHCGASGVFIDESHRNLPELKKAISGIPDFLTVVVNGKADDFSSGEGEWARIRTRPSPRNDSQLATLCDGDLAAIVYTSGTTGRPKGVKISHLNLATNTESIQRCLEINCSQKVINLLPFYYSFGNSVLNTHLLAGASIILQDNLAFPQLVWKKIDEHCVTSLYGVPSTFNLLLSRTAYDTADLSTLKFIAQAGGAMSISRIQQLKSLVPNAHLYIMYGQTEATARLTCLPSGMLMRKLGSVGLGIPGVEIAVRGIDGKELGPNLPGEICARGRNIMSGYWNDAEATAKVLRGDWLLTGDHGYLDEDGYLYIQGRRSDMIKAGANRVSPEEIEQVLSCYPGIKEVGVYGFPDEMLGETIAADVVAETDAELDLQAIRRYCLKRLAPYKVPKKLSLVAQLPKTSSGKVKRYELTKKAKETGKSG